MNIVILVTHLPPEFIGGTETQTIKLAKKLSEKNKVILITRKELKKLPWLEKRDKFLIKRFRIINFPVLRFFSHLIFSLNEIRKIRKDIDILQTMMLTPNGLVGVFAGKLFRIKHISWVRGGDWYFAKNSFLGRKIIRFVLKNSDLILVQTSEIKKDILHWCPGISIRVMQNGVDIPKNKAFGDKIIFLGSLVERKGVKYLINAMKNIKNELLIIGDGPKRRELEDLSKNMKNIKFVGKVYPEDINKYLIKGKILVLPSIKGEGQPNVILEAMSIGLPVVATNIAGIPDTIQHKTNGFLVRPRDSKSLAKYINRLLNDKDLLRTMRNNCINDAEKIYSWKNVIDKLEQIYKTIIK